MPDPTPGALNLAALMRDQLAAQPDLDDWDFDLARDVLTALVAHEIDQAGGVDAIDWPNTVAELMAIASPHIERQELEHLSEMHQADDAGPVASLNKLVEAKAKAQHQERLRRRN